MIHCSIVVVSSVTSTFWAALLDVAVVDAVQVLGIGSMYGLNVQWMASNVLER